MVLRLVLYVWRRSVDRQGRIRNYGHPCVFLFSAPILQLTIALAIVTTFIILIRAVTLENAGRGVKLYFGTWNGSQLAGGQIWQTAVGQVFFSTGVAFGYCE